MSPPLFSSDAVFSVNQQPALDTTQSPEPERLTTADVRVLTVTSGLRTLDEVLWGPALIDRLTVGQMTRLVDVGRTQLPGAPVRIDE